jgi:hypothetical protein
MKLHRAQVLVVASVWFALNACGRVERSPSEASVSAGGSPTAASDVEVPNAGGTGGSGGAEIPNTGGTGGTADAPIIHGPAGAPGQAPSDAGVPADYVPPYRQIDTTACHARSAEPCLPGDEALARIAQRCREAYVIKCGELAAWTDALGCINDASVSISGDVGAGWCLYKELQAAGPLCEARLKSVDSPFLLLLPVCVWTH